MKQYIRNFISFLRSCR